MAIIGYLVCVASIVTLVYIAIHNIVQKRKLEAIFESIDVDPYSLPEKRGILSANYTVNPDDPNHLVTIDNHGIYLINVTDTKIAVTSYNQNI